MFAAVPASSSVRAFVATFHLAMGVLRTHRTPATGVFGFVTGISLLLAGSPWLMPSPIGLAVGLAMHLQRFSHLCSTWCPALAGPLGGPPEGGHYVHLETALAWFVACGRLLPVRVSAPVRTPAPPALPRPVIVAPAPGSVPPRPHTPAAADAPRRPRDFVQVPVLAVFDETPDIRTFRMARPEGFAFKAGQFVAIRVRADGREHDRCYSVSSSPARSR